MTDYDGENGGDAPDSAESYDPRIARLLRDASSRRAPTIDEARLSVLEDRLVLVAREEGLLPARRDRIARKLGAFLGGIFTVRAGGALVMGRNRHRHWAKSVAVGIALLVLVLLAFMLLRA